MVPNARSLDMMFPESLPKPQDHEPISIVARQPRDKYLAGLYTLQKLVYTLVHVLPWGLNDFRNDSPGVLSNRQGPVGNTTKYIFKSIDVNDVARRIDNRINRLLLLFHPVSGS